MTESVIEVQYRKNKIVEKYIIEGEPGINYRVKDND